MKRLRRPAAVAQVCLSPGKPQIPHTRYSRHFAVESGGGPVRDDYCARRESLDRCCRRSSGRFRVAMAALLQRCPACLVPPRRYGCAAGRLVFSRGQMEGRAAGNRRAVDSLLPVSDSFFPGARRESTAVIWRRSREANRCQTAYSPRNSASVTEHKKHYRTLGGPRRSRLARWPSGAKHLLSAEATGRSADKQGS